MWPNIPLSGNGQFLNIQNSNDSLPDPLNNLSATGQAFSEMEFEPVNDESGRGFMPSFPAESGLFNSQNFHFDHQTLNPNAQFPQQQVYSARMVTPTSRSTAPQLSDRAAELRAQLLKNRRANAATSPTGTPNLSVARKTTEHPEISNSLHQCPQTPIEKYEQELSVNALISQFSETKGAATASAIQENPRIESNAIKINPTSSKSTISANLQASSLGNPDNLNTLAGNGHYNCIDSVEKLVHNRHNTNGSLSDVSEGEIFEDAVPKKSEAPTETRDIEYNSKAAKSEKDAQKNKRPFHEDSPPCRSDLVNPQLKISRPAVGRRAEVELHPAKKANQLNYQTASKPVSNNNAHSYPRHEPQEPKYGIMRSNLEQSQAEALDDLLSRDTDLKEWLEITAYHNTPYRNKILSRRRAIAALDAEREKLLAEMKADERGGLPPIIAVQPRSSSMLPPPIPDEKLGDRFEHESSTTASNNSDRIMSGKRPRNHVHESVIDKGPGKHARVDDRNHTSRMKEMEDFDVYRPRSHGYDSDRRRSLDRRDDEEYSRPHLDGTASSREREPSPGIPAYQRRPLAQYRDDSYDDFEDRGSRLFEIRGNYRGRSYDPNFRGRGRGRGRADRRDFHDSSEPRSEASYSSKIANSRPHKDIQARSRGSI